MTIPALLLTLLAAPAPCAKTAPAVQSSTSPVVLTGARPRRSISELRERFVESVEEPARRAALAEISETPPETLRDVSALFDLFARFPQGGAREAVLSSLDKLDESSALLEPGFIEYIKLTDSEARIFGIHGALRLRSQRALPLIRKIAEPRFVVRSPGESPVLSDKNAWLAQYEALAALAQLQGAEALPLLRKKADEAPLVARLMGAYLWKQSLPDFIKWSGSRGSTEKAREGLGTEVPLAALRETRARMLDVLRDPKADRELRHQLAIKTGLVSTPEEVDVLLAELAAAKDPETRLAFSAALFASRSPRTVPWLKKLAAQDPDPKMRVGALLQLRLLLPAAEVRPLLEEAALKDPDPENRQEIERVLKAPPEAAP